MMCWVYSSRPKRPSSSGTSRTLCQSVTWTSWSQEQGAHGVAQQGREVARHRRDHQHLGLGDAAGLAKAEQGGERRDA